MEGKNKFLIIKYLISNYFKLVVSFIIKIRLKEYSFLDIIRKRNRRKNWIINLLLMRSNLTIKCLYCNTSMYKIALCKKKQWIKIKSFPCLNVISKCIIFHVYILLYLFMLYLYKSLSLILSPEAFNFLTRTCQKLIPKCFQMKREVSNLFFIYINEREKLMSPWKSNLNSLSMN